MEAAKHAANKFLSRDHHNDTEVVEKFNKAITKETFIPIKKVEETVAVDREVHVDHYQTRIQPIADQVREREEHVHKVAPVQYREKKLGDHEHIHHQLRQEQDKLKSTRTVLDTRHEHVDGGVLEAEHIHHHVYENVQPVIEREIVQETIVHTTVPIKEKIIQESIHHPITVQPTMTLEEFRRAGGAIEGKSQVRDVFKGEPIVRENGGANETHPNVHREGGLLGGHNDHHNNNHNHNHNGAAGTAGIAAATAAGGHRTGRHGSRVKHRSGSRSSSSSSASSR